MKKIVILGSTGSIGTSTLDVIRRAPDRFRVIGLAANSRWQELEKQALEFGVSDIVMFEPAAAQQLRRAHGDWNIRSGGEGLIELAAHPDADLVVASMVGAAGARPVLSALQAGTDVGLANKEVLVMGGELVTAAARANGVKLLPIDSEHNALFQCLVGEDIGSVDRLVLTASGGPFFARTGDLEEVTVAEALNHPRWEMGRKVTIDSATLMNKGLEVIEAHHLFGVPPEKISVVVHQQSIVHSLVEFADGSLKAQLGVTDMRLPIAYVLDYPERHANDLPKLKLVDLEQLTFALPDKERFPALQLAFDAVRTGGTAPAIMNAANEVAVSAFLERRLSFPGISRLVAETLAKVVSGPALDWETVLDADLRARTVAREVLE